VTKAHDALWEAYVADLREAKEIAEGWWRDLLKEDARGSTRLPPKQRWPDGPASHPVVIGVIIKYTQACHALNLGLSREDLVPTNEFIIESLMDDETEDLEELTDTLTYWPLTPPEPERPQATNS
jgi:hypothetical protein